MIDWEDLAQRQIADLQRALPEPIRARAMEVPVFLSRGREGKSRACLGLFQGYSLKEGPPTLPDELPRITLFIDVLAQATHYQQDRFVHEVRITYLHELGHYFGWDEGQVSRAGLA
jgi:predicted Zn-dependent protease with MMP-like domain